MSREPNFRDRVEAKARRLAEDRLIRERALDDRFDSLWEREASARGKLSAGEKARFWALHRQFRGQIVPGLPSAVRAARFVWSRLRRIRQ